MSEHPQPQQKVKPSGNGWFSWMLLTMLLALSAFTLLLYGVPSVKHDVQGYKVEQYVEKAGNACDLTTKAYKPSFAPSGWKIYCVDSIPMREIKGWSKKGIIYGITFPNPDQNVIEVSRDTPVDLLRHVITHEWVHAYVAEKNLHDSPRWGRWKKYLGDQGNIISDNYDQDPDEILADNVALATEGGDNTVNGVMKLPPKDIWNIFPELKPVAGE